MSLVGFRPALKSEYEEYEYHHKARIAMKPGITGMWQVSGRSDITDFEEVVKLDTEYIRTHVLIRFLNPVKISLMESLSQEPAEADSCKLS